MPLPRPRSVGARTVAVVRRAHGQLNDSPTASPTRVEASIPADPTNPAAAPNSDQTTTAAGYRTRTATLSASSPAGIIIAAYVQRNADSTPPKPSFVSPNSAVMSGAHTARVCLSR
jgi:hypothetical protein